MNLEDSFDYIVVGAGSAGCTVVYRLVNAGAKVLLLEAGPNDDAPDIHDINDYRFIKLWGSDRDWQLMSEPQPGMNGRQIFISQGKVIGGGSSINAMMYVRGDRRDYDYWHSLGNEGWSYNEVLPYFKKSEDYAHGPDQYHGVGGQIKGIKCPTPTEVSLAYLDATVELGYQGGRTGDYNIPDHNGVSGLIQLNMAANSQGKFERCSEADGFLKPVLSQTNLTVKTGAEVTKILFNGTRAIGIEYIQNSQTHQVGASQEVVITAGAYLSPKILMLSGIGPAAQLRSHQIPVIANLPGVGQNLQDHLRLIWVWKSKVETPVPDYIVEAAFFPHSTGSTTQAPDIQINFSSGIPAFIPPEYAFAGPFSIFVPILLQESSVGEVKLRSADPLALPIVNPNYLQTDQDIKTYIKAVEICRELANTKAFAPFNAGEVMVGPGDTVEAYIRNNAQTIWHPAGTCKMGRDQMAVVDPQLRVHGITGLRVADASIMPKVTSGNTNAPTVMIAEKAADLILADR